MTRVYRHVPNGITWIERGPSTPVLALPDHGDALWRWMTPDVSTLVYDDDLHAVETETIEDERARLRAALTAAVAESKIPPTAKADVRKIIDEVYG